MIILIRVPQRMNYFKLLASIIDSIEPVLLWQNKLKYRIRAPAICMANMTLTVPISATGVMLSYPIVAILSLNGCVSGCSPKTF